jgi:DNA-binding CsgD family transcriptional regulator
MSRTRTEPFAKRRCEEKRAEAMAPTQHFDGSLGRLLADTYEAALDPGAWVRLLPKLIDFVGGWSGMIGVTKPVASMSSAALMHNIDPVLIARHSADFSAVDPWVDSYQRRHGPIAKADGIWLHGPAYVDTHALRKTAVGQEIFDPIGIGDLLTVGLSSLSDRFNFFATFRPSRAPGFGASSIRRFRMLAPHVVRASQIQKRVIAIEGRIDAASHALAHVPYGLFALAADGHVLTMNPEAERILNARDGLTTRCGVLAATAAPDRLRAAMSRAGSLAASATTEHGEIVRIPRPSARRPYQVLMAPVPAAPSERLLGFTGRPTVAIAIVCDPEASPLPTAAALCQLFSLTPALSRLAATLAAGKTLAEHAEEARITVGTARVQLKELFARTNTSRQAELVRVLLTSLAALRTPTGAE